jgi:hypothetical protein
MKGLWLLAFCSFTEITFWCEQQTILPSLWCKNNKYCFHALSWTQVTCFIYKVHQSMYCFNRFVIKIYKARVGRALSVYRGLNDPGLIPGTAQFFSYLQHPDRVLIPAKPPTQREPGTLSPGIKRPRRESDQSPTNAKIKKSGAMPPLPPPEFLYGKATALPFHI